MGVPHIAGLDGAELPPGEVGTIFFEDGTRSEYHGDPGQTASAANERGWRTVGDVGYLDRDGYLYFTDRASNLIISGGVNIYPRRSRTCSPCTRTCSTPRCSACPTRRWASR